MKLVSLENHTLVVGWRYSRYPRTRSGGGANSTSFMTSHSTTTNHFASLTIRKKNNTGRKKTDLHKLASSFYIYLTHNSWIAYIIPKRQRYKSSFSIFWSELPEASTTQWQPSEKSWWFYFLSSYIRMAFGFFAIGRSVDDWANTIFFQGHSFFFYSFVSFRRWRLTFDLKPSKEIVTRKENKSGTNDDDHILSQLPSKLLRRLFDVNGVH